MLKTIGSLNKPGLNRNNSSKLVSYKNDGNKPASERNDNYSEIKFGDNNIKHAKKSRKLKSQKTSKFWNLAKSRKKLLKSKNLPNFGITEAGPKFLTPDIRTTFNYFIIS